MFSSEARKVLFDSRGMGQADVYLKNDRIFTTLFKGGETEVISRADIPLRGMHNVENIMASLGATICALGLDREALPTLREAIKSFLGVEHRIEFVAEINGVRYYNDSKATNVDSTIKALEAFDRGIVLILGGKDKGSDYSVLTPLIRERVKEVILIGAASSKIESHLQSACSMSRADSMEHAVRLGKQAAQPGDTVLLAPACASFDMFENYDPGLEARSRESRGQADLAARRRRARDVGRQGASVRYPGAHVVRSRYGLQRVSNARPKTIRQPVLLSDPAVSVGAGGIGRDGRGDSNRLPAIQAAGSRSRAARHLDRDASCRILLPGRERHSPMV